MDDIGFEVIDHQPYSPDLSPYDFWLFPELKNIKGKAFRYTKRHKNGYLPLPQIQDATFRDMGFS